jgi:septum formation protein
MTAEHRLLLASKSPRRQTLLTSAGFAVRCVPSRDEPQLLTHGNGERLALAAALAKLPKYQQDLVLISADTVVHLDHTCLGKPVDRSDAMHMLEQLSGQTHGVTTAVAMRGGGDVVSFAVTSWVRFRHLGSFEIEQYVASGEPMDKAGAYGIQGLGAGLIESVEGSHTAVVGLPMRETVAALAEMGVHPK